MPSVINGSDNFNSAYGAALKAWVNFNGVSTASVRASLNVSSVTRNGAGDYTVNFSTALADSNYAVTLTAFDSASGTFVPKILSSGNSTAAPSLMSTSSVRIAYGGSGGVADVTVFSVAVFR